MQVLISALYTANNLATGDNEVKAEILSAGLHELIPAGLRFCCGDDATTFEVRPCRPPHPSAGPVLPYISPDYIHLASQILGHIIQLTLALTTMIRY